MQINPVQQRSGHFRLIVCSTARRACTCFGNLVTYIVLTLEAVKAELDLKLGLYNALEAAAKAKNSHIDEVGLARAIVSICGRPESYKPLNGAADSLLKSMELIFNHINRKHRAADEEKKRHLAKTIVEQQRKIFNQDYPKGATREQALFLFERIGDALDHSLEAKAIREQMLALSAEFGLDSTPTENIPDFDKFITKLRVLKESFAIQRSQADRVNQVKRAKSSPQPKKKSEQESH